MYCSTCGAYLPEGTRECTACGAAAARPKAGTAAVSHSPEPSRRYGKEDARWLAHRRVGVCPRCGYRGEGITYFSRGIHAAALIGFTVLTAGAMGAGGLVYYLVRREHRVCPRCGYGWGRYGERSLAPTESGSEIRQMPRIPPAGRERARRTTSVLLYLFAAIMLVLGVAESLLPALVIAVASGTGALLLHRSANHEREQRRRALIAGLQLHVLKLASERSGRLTVTEVASSLGWTMPRAEKVLNSLEDGLRVNSEVTDEGVIVYEFLELIHSRASLRPPDHLSPEQDRPDS